MKYLEVATGRVAQEENWLSSYMCNSSQESFSDDVESGKFVLLDETHERVIFDRSGGCTLQLRSWAHCYQDINDAAHVLAKWIHNHELENHENTALALCPSVQKDKFQIVGIDEFLTSSTTFRGRPYWPIVRKFRHVFRLEFWRYHNQKSEESSGADGHDC